MGLVTDCACDCGYSISAVVVIAAMLLSAVAGFFIGLLGGRRYGATRR